jgi:hypothetical protein
VRSEGNAAVCEASHTHGAQQRSETLIEVEESKHLASSLMLNKERALG